MKKRRMIASRAEKFTCFASANAVLEQFPVAIATGLAFWKWSSRADQLAPIRQLMSLSARLWRLLALASNSDCDRNQSVKHG